MELAHNSEESDEKENFNLPEEVTEVFRIQYGNGKFEEYSSRVCICWEDIMGLKEYPYPDQWEKYVGEKYYISMHGQVNDILIMGSYDRMRDKFFRFRKTHPIFRNYETDEE